MKKKFYNIWGIEIPNCVIDRATESYILNLPIDAPDLEWIWSEMDRVWGLLGLDNKKPLRTQPIEKFYSHPIWLLNGIFTSVDSISKNHRRAIAAFIVKQKPAHIADYGGGFGELAITISKLLPDAVMSIIEPYPPDFGQTRIKHFQRISYKKNLSSNYDAVIAQDILEHVEDPIGLAYILSSSINRGGFVIFANNFNPVILCHLPCTFHLRHTFNFVMKAMGLTYKGRITGANHAKIFQKLGSINLSKARSAEAISKLVGPLLNNTDQLLFSFKKRLIRQ